MRYPLPTNITIDSHQIHDAVSRETMCFSCAVSIDGKPAGRVENDGQGGAHRYDPNGLEARLEAIAATLPPLPLPKSMRIEGQLNELTMNADLLINELVQHADNARHLKRALARRLVVIRDGQVRQTKPLTAAALAQSLEPRFLPETLRAVGGDAVTLLNTLPFPEALARYEDALAEAE